jgi:hypothetical protein
MYDTNSYLRDYERPYEKITVIVEKDGKKVTSTFEKTVDATWEARYEEPEFDGYGRLIQQTPVIKEMRLSFQPLPNNEGLMLTTKEEEIDG